MTTEYEMRDELHQSFVERLEDMRGNPYWQDELSEIADSFVDVYNTGRVDQWRALGCPEIEDTGLIEGVTDIFQIIAVAIYEYASTYLHELAHECDELN